MTPIHATSRPPRVVIVGAGFGGLSAAKQLAKAPFEVTVVDHHNYHLLIASDPGQTLGHDDARQNGLQHA